MSLAEAPSVKKWAWNSFLTELTSATKKYSFDRQKTSMFLIFLNCFMFIATYHFMKNQTISLLSHLPTLAFHSNNVPPSALVRLCLLDWLFFRLIARKRYFALIICLWLDQFLQFLDSQIIQSHLFVFFFQNKHLSLLLQLPCLKFCFDISDFGSPRLFAHHFLWLKFWYLLLYFSHHLKCDYFVKISLLFLLILQNPFDFLYLRMMSNNFLVFFL